MTIFIPSCSTVFFPDVLRPFSLNTDASAERTRLRDVYVSLNHNRKLEKTFKNNLAGVGLVWFLLVCVFGLF